ncbi:MAG TPA: 3-deoxy-manno-octulosonate cytidylyltransferase [Candidatus Omnitrophota bacterium]|nr:3-deoxy-manno-octulosonate cytidylyltransferase [Candidatus Omnitrophota bacterium]
MNIIGIIPGRMASSRYPGKPLAKIAGIPMIGHCYFRSKMSQRLNEVYIATCDKEIADYGDAVGARCVMTKDTHERATDRIAEAVDKIEAQTGKRVDIVVMIQGDEPMTQPGMIDEAVEPLLKDNSIVIANLMAPIMSREEHDDPNEVKVVVDRQGFALYFSREPIPSWRKGAKEVPMLKQVCVIPFRRDFLKTFITLSPTPLEIIESVDMLRAMEHGYKVKMVMTKFESYSVDTPEDLQFAETYLLKDALVAKYPKC